MLMRLQLTHAYPINVNVNNSNERRLVQADAVKELVIEHNPDLTDNVALLKVLAGFPNLRELYMGNTGFTLTKDQMKMANSNIKLIKSKPV